MRMDLLEELETKLTGMVHGLLRDAKAAEPVIEDAVTSALAESGAPGEVAAAVGALVKALRGHFASVLQPEPTAPAETAPAETAAA